MFNDIKGNLNTANVLLIHVKRLRAVREIRGPLNYLAKILKQKMNKPVTVEDTLQLMFLKMKGRQEMDFMGIDEITLRRTCKPVEYLIEADMFF